MKKIGNQLRQLRENAKLSQEKIAKFAGTNQPSINRYENGHITPPLAILEWYAEFFGVSMDYIFARAGKTTGHGMPQELSCGAEKEKPVLLRDIITESAAAHPDLTAYLYKNARTEPYQQATYRKTMDDIFALGAKLVDMGLSGKHIAVIGDNCYQWAIAYFAVLFGVGVVVPLDKELRPGEIKHLLQLADCAAIFFTERHDDALKEVDFIPYKIRMNVYEGTPNPKGSLTWRTLVDAGKALPQEKIDAHMQTEIDENAPAALLFTSGTTDDAKGVMLSNRGMGTNLRDMTAAHNVKPGGITLSILPMHHCFEAVMGQQFMLANGVAIAFGDGLKFLQRNMAEVRPTVMLFVPLLLENFYNKIMAAVRERGAESDLRRRINDYIKLRTELGANDDSKARLIARELFATEQALFGGRLDSIFTGAAAIDPQVIRGLQEIGIKITYGYGMTECGPLMTTTPYFSDTMGKFGSVGPVTQSGAIRIRRPDEKGIGEICYKGEALMLGYYGQPEATADVLEGEWFKSGDFGVIDDDGWLYITGRKANIIVTKTGKNVFPEELEAELRRIPFIEEAMVYAAEDKKRGGALISAQIRPDFAKIAEIHGAEAAADEAQLLELLRTAVAGFNAGIANYKRIRHIQIRIGEFAKTPTKKILRSRNV